MPNAFKIILRFLWFIISRVLIWAAAAGIVVLAFFAAMDYMNARILTSDGLQARAEVIIKSEDPTTLSDIFSKGFLEQDEMLQSNAYSQYLVDDMDYDIDFNKFTLIFPWHDTATLRITEKVTNIDAEVIGSADTDEEISETPPTWDYGVYDVTLARYEENWRVVSMELVEVLPLPTSEPTEAPSPTEDSTTTETSEPSPSASSSVPQADAVED